MKKKSAGVLPFRYRDGLLEVFLVHPGGPYYEGKDDHIWSISKGLIDNGEDTFEAAKREFKEETGKTLSSDSMYEYLGLYDQSTQKSVEVWIKEEDALDTDIESNTSELEWPKDSGQMQEVPEVDKAEWFEISVARKRIIKGQIQVLDRLEEVA